MTCCRRELRTITAHKDESSLSMGSKRAILFARSHKPRVWAQRRAPSAEYRQIIWEGSARRHHCFVLSVIDHLLVDRRTSRTHSLTVGHGWELVPVPHLFIVAAGSTEARQSSKPFTTAPLSFVGHPLSSIARQRDQLNNFLGHHGMTENSQRIRDIIDIQETEDRRQAGTGVGTRPEG